MKKNRENILFLLGNYYSFFVIGLMVLLLGAIMPYLLRDYQLSYDQGGTLIMLQALGNLTATVLGGIISVYIGRRAILVFGALTIAAGYGGIALVSAPAAMYVLVTVSGLGWGIMNNLTNVVVSEKTKGDASALNILHMSFGIGALFAPFLVSITVAADWGWRTAMVLVAAFSLILAYVFMRMDLPEPELSHEAQEKTAKISFDFLRDLRFYNFMLILFLYVGSESVVNGWLTTYILDTGIADEYFAQRLLSFTWFAVIAGRMACAWLSKHTTKENLLLAGGLGSLLFSVLLLVSNNLLLVYVAVLGLGLSFSGIYPNTVANASYLIHGSATASGIMFSLGGLGASLIPYIVGLRAESGGIGTGMNTLIASTLLLAVFCIVNLLMGLFGSMLTNKDNKVI